MASITHDWDEEDYAATLEKAYVEYREACYRGKELPPSQNREVRQAFFSGIHWLNCRDDYCPDEVLAATDKLLRATLTEGE
jgi:hypothetical protein